MGGSSHEELGPSFTPREWTSLILSLLFLLRIWRRDSNFTLRLGAGGNQKRTTIFFIVLELPNYFVLE